MDLMGKCYIFIHANTHFCHFNGGLERDRIECLAQYRSIVSALAMEILQSCTEPSIRPVHNSSWALNTKYYKRRVAFTQKYLSDHITILHMPRGPRWLQYHYSEVIMGVMASQIICVSIVCPAYCPGADHGIIKAPRHWPLWGESTTDRPIPLTKGQLRGKCFLLRTSSWWNWQLFTSALIHFCMASLTWRDPYVENRNRTEIEQGWPGSLIEPTEEAFELSHGSACIIGWKSRLLDISISP